MAEPRSVQEPTFERFRWTVKLSFGSLGVVCDVATDRRKRWYVGVNYLQMHARWTVKLSFCSVDVAYSLGPDRRKRRLSGES
jgi:hypothetical protein